MWQRRREHSDELSSVSKAAELSLLWLPGQRDGMCIHVTQPQPGFWSLLGIQYTYTSLLLRYELCVKFDKLDLGGDARKGRQVVRSPSGDRWGHTGQGGSGFTIHCCRVWNLLGSTVATCFSSWIFESVWVVYLIWGTWCLGL